MNNLGSVLKDVARYDEALEWLRKGAEALRDNPAAHSNVLFTLVGYELEPAAERLGEAQRFAEQFGQHPFERWRDRIPDPDPQRRLKIGLVSPDFCRHAVSYFVEPLLEQWNRQTLEITLYSCGEQFDDYSARLQSKADHWVNLHGAKVMKPVSTRSCKMKLTSLWIWPGIRQATAWLCSAPKPPLFRPPTSGITAQRGFLKWTTG